MEVETFGFIKRFAKAVGGYVVSAGKSVWDGTTYLWGKAVDVGESLATMAAATWDGAQTLGVWIEQGAKIAGHYTVEFFKRDFYAIYDVLHMAVEVLHDAGLDLYNGCKDYGRGLVEIAKGNFGDGTTLLFVGLARMSIELGLNVLTTAVVHTLSQIQTVLFLEPLPRGLTGEEREALSRVHGGERWWFSLIQIKDGFSFIWSTHDAPFTNQTTIFMKKRRDQRTAGDYLAIIVHEVTHVWQYIHGGGNYRLNSLLYRALDGQDQYNWEKDAPGTSWDKLKAEQQARLIEDGFRARFFDTPQVLPFLGSTGTDFTAYLDAAVGSLRRGEGTPAL